MCLYMVIPLHTVTIFTVTKIQLQKQNNMHNTSTELNNHIKINCFNRLSKKNEKCMHAWPTPTYAIV